MDELQSVGVGVALGLAVVSFLTLYPGEPFEYSTDGDNARDTKHLSSMKANTFNDNPRQTIVTTESSGTRQQEQLAAIEHAAQHVKMQKLQELLGIEKGKIQDLVERAKEEAKEAVKPTSSSYSTTSNGAWLDRCFFIVMFGLFFWVLWQDYSINLFSIAAHLLPREAEAISQITAVPRDLVYQVLELWQ